MPKPEKYVERKDPPVLYTRRTSYAKTIFMLEEGTDELQKHPRLGSSVREQWIRFRGNTGGVVNGQAQGFPISALLFLCDNFRPLVEAYREAGNWFPTMCCSVEVKKEPPTVRKWEWLFMRVEARTIMNWANNIGVVILNEEGGGSCFVEAYGVGCACGEEFED